MPKGSDLLVTLCQGPSGIRFNEHIEGGGPTVFAFGALA
jgi:hypothetical protein